MEITINYYGQAVSVSVEVSEEVFDVLCQFVWEIAADEGATESVTSAIRKLQKIFAKNGWLNKQEN